MLMALILTSTFIAVVAFAIGLTMRSEREILQERMQRHAQGVIPPIDIDYQLPLKQRVFRPLLAKLSSFGTKFTPHGTAESVNQKLDAAGRPFNLRASEYMGLRVFTVGVFVLLALIASSHLGNSAVLHIAAFALLLFIGFVLPESLLQNAIGKRQSAIRKALPDTLDLLTVSVEAGLGLHGAMQKVVEKLHNPLAEEMQRALNEMRAGQRRTDALRKMAKRVKVNELSTFVAATCQAEQLGVSISKVLRVQSSAIRDQRSFKARELAAKLPVKMLFPLIFFIFPALFVVVLAPGAIQIFRALGLFH